MKKLFYKAFGALYEAVAHGRHLTKKEDLYRLIFEHTSFGEVFSDDPIRKVTSGIRPIHERIVKSACTDDGFESLRFSVEEECLPYIDGWQRLTEELLVILHSEAPVPDTVKPPLKEAWEDTMHTGFPGLSREYFFALTMWTEAGR